MSTKAQLITEITNNYPDNTGGLITPAIHRQTTIDIVNSVPTLSDSDQVIAGGANVTSLNLGTISSGTVVIDCGQRPLQYLTNNGAFTIAAPANDGSAMILVTNSGSAGAITFSGFAVGSLTGDPLDTISGHKFSVSIWRINGTSGFRVAAHQ